MFSHLLEPCVKMWKFLMILLKLFSNLGNFLSKNHWICNKKKKPPNFWKSENLHQKKWLVPPLLSDYIIGSSTSCLIIIFFTLSTSMARSTTSSFAFFSEIACWNKAKKTVGNYTPSIAFILYSYYFRAKRMHAMYNLPTKRWVFNHWSHFIKTMFHLATFVLVSYVWSISSIFLMIMC